VRWVEVVETVAGAGVDLDAGAVVDRVGWVDPRLLGLVDSAYALTVGTR
jgi:hypothetical protein